MKKCYLNSLSKIGLIVGVILVLSQPIFSGLVYAETPLVPQQKSLVIQGKIVDNMLMLVDETGKQTLAADGVYTIQGGSKIIVNQGQIIDVDTKVINKSGMVGIIDVPG